MSAFMEVNLPYVSLLVGVVASSMLYVVVLYQVQKLRCSVVFYKQRVEGLEERLSAAVGTPYPRQPETSRAAETSRVAGSGRAETSCAPEQEIPTPEATQQKVLHLHGLGRSREEIARQAGIREAEVDFVLKVSEHVGTPGGTLALRKIS